MSRFPLVARRFSTSLTSQVANIIVVKLLVDLMLYVDIQISGTGQYGFAVSVSTISGQFRSSAANVFQHHGSPPRPQVLPPRPLQRPVLVPPQHQVVLLALGSSRFPVKGSL